MAGYCSVWRHLKYTELMPKQFLYFEKWTENALTSQGWRGLWLVQVEYSNAKCGERKWNTCHTVFHLEYFSGGALTTSRWCTFLMGNVYCECAYQLWCAPLECFEIEGLWDHFWLVFKTNSWYTRCSGSMLHWLIFLKLRLWGNLWLHLRMNPSDIEGKGLGAQ